MYDTIQINGLEAQRKQLLEEVKLLKKQEASMNALPEFANLLTEKDCLRKEISDIHKAIWQDKEQLKKRKKFVADLKLARSGDQLMLKAIIKEIPKDCLMAHALDRRTISPAAVLKFLTITNTIESFERSLNAVSSYIEMESLAMQTAIAQREGRLAIIDSYIQQVRQIRREQIKEKEKEAEALSAKIRELQPPTMPQCQPATTVSPSVSRPRPFRTSNALKEDPPTEDVSPENVGDPSLWRIFIRFDDNGKDMPLPNNLKDFVECLHPMLNERKLYHLDCELLYKKLMGELRKPRDRRQRLSQIKGKKMFHKKKKVKVGKFYRLFCHFNEKERIVIFSPQTHDAYQDIWRT